MRRTRVPHTRIFILRLPQGDAASRIWRVHFLRAFAPGGGPDAPFPSISPGITRFTMVNRMQFTSMAPRLIRSSRNPRPSSIRRPKRRCTGGCAWLQGRRRQGGRRGLARVFETFSHDQPRGARRAADEDHRGLQDPYNDIGAAVFDEMGAPLPMAEKLQAGAGFGHIAGHAGGTQELSFRGEPLGSAMVVREPVGVIGMITPWNWPLNQIACASRRRWPPVAPWS